MITVMLFKNVILIVKTPTSYFFNYQESRASDKILTGKTKLFPEVLSLKKYSSEKAMISDHMGIWLHQEKFLKVKGIIFSTPKLGFDVAAVYLF